MQSISPLDVALPGVALKTAVLGALALVMIFILVVFVESVVLQLIGWGNLRESLRGAFWMNLASTAAGFLLLVAVNRLAVFGLILSWACSVLIEGLVLRRFWRQKKPSHWYAALSANLVSYLLLIVPAYLFRG
ncbi:MAG: hypothetical protein B6D39_03010 [Anaerolineae bacterium UTCFX2]|nr:hypothetical protein [Anaerolineales bacterium]OQY93532.1 MAG: hypothetical protein B6D39_03010 [Anaerolineae bacterium UTCFX2]